MLSRNLNPADEVPQSLEAEPQGFDAGLSVVVATATLLQSPDRAYISLALMLAGLFAVACWPDDELGGGC